MDDGYGPSNQMHGKKFENWIKTASIIFGHMATDRRRQPTDRFDIGAQEDLKRGIPTSIKTTKGHTVTLADARLFWQSMDYVPYRMLIGEWVQEGDRKIFNRIHEIIIEESYSSFLLGTVSEDRIAAFHAGLTRFGPGKDEQAKASTWARKQKQELEDALGAVVLNPKIDSKNQRRLQCSVHLDKLVAFADKYGHYTLHEGTFYDLVLPYQFVSARRKFKPDKQG